MDWKKFFKPTKAKIITAIIILIIFVPFIIYDNGTRCFMAPCPSSSYASIALWLLLSLVSLLARHSFVFIYSISLPILIIGIILSYLISCLIIFKKRKK